VLKFGQEIYDQRDKKDEDLDKRKNKYETQLKDEQCTFDSVIKDLDDNIEGCINFSDAR